MPRDYSAFYAREAGDSFESKIRTLAITYFQLNPRQATDLLPRRIGRGEFDIIYEDHKSNIVTCIEATISKKELYIQEKLQTFLDYKLVQLGKEFPGRAIQVLIVTKKSDANQKRLFDKLKESHHLTNFFLYDENLFIGLAAERDSGSFENKYLQLRIRRPFGSARNPDEREAAIDIPGIKYLDCNMCLPNGDSIGLDGVCRLAKEKKITLMTGEYGIGKSLTLAKLFEKLASDYSRGESKYFPVYIDLNQVNRIGNDPVTMDDLIYFHLTEIAYRGDISHALDSVYSEQCVMILDGLDEVSARNENRFQRSNHVLETRKNLGFLREYIQNNANRKGIILSARSNFFLSFKEEVVEILGLSPSSYLHISFRPFTLEEAQKLFALYGVKDPESLHDMKPLLLSKIALAGGLPPDQMNIVDSIISREFNLHHDKNNASITHKEFRRLVFEIISRTMVSGQTFPDLNDGVLNDIYTKTIGYAPTQTQIDELKKLMILRRNHDGSVVVYDDYVSDMIVVLLLKDVCESFIGVFNNTTFERHSKELIALTFEKLKYDLSVVRSWRRMVNFRGMGPKVLRAAMQECNLDNLRFNEIVRGLVENRMFNAAFQTLYAGDIFTLVEEVDISDLENIEYLNSRQFENQKRFVNLINCNVDEFEVDSMDQGNPMVKFHKGLILSVKYQDQELKYFDEAPSWFSENLIETEVGLVKRARPTRTTASDFLVTSNGTDEKRTAVFWCLSLIKRRNRVAHSDFFRNAPVNRKPIDRALNRLLLEGFLTTFFAHDSVRYKFNRERATEIEQMIATEKLGASLSEWCR